MDDCLVGFALLKQLDCIQTLAIDSLARVLQFLALSRGRGPRTVRTGKKTANRRFRRRSEARCLVPESDGAECGNVPSPKDDIDGSMVGEVYWKEKNIERIATYCQKDVVTVANIVCRFKNLPLLNTDQVVFVK